MKNRRGTLLGAALALPLAGLAIPGMAAQPACAPANGANVVLRWSAPATQVATAPTFTQVSAIFRQMAAEMNAMQTQMMALAAMPLPSPQQMIQAALGPGGWTLGGPGVGTVFTAMTNGSGSCSETITYQYPANGQRPIMHVSQRGDACSAVHWGPTGLTPAAQATVRSNVQPMPPRLLPRPMLPTEPPRLVTAAWRTATAGG
ncbi:MAG TPA: hypothetical protein VFW75_04510 [Acetobacteraceae bacterium]|nr:hypothetical protein [Acetobacteraceae bacterium]